MILGKQLDEQWMKASQGKVVDRLAKERPDLKLEGHVDHYTLQKGMRKVDEYYSIEQTGQDRTLSFRLIYQHLPRDPHTHNPMFQIILRKRVPECFQSLSQELHKLQDSKDQTYLFLKHIIRKYFNQEPSEDSDEDSSSQRNTFKKKNFSFEEKKQSTAPQQFRPYPHPGSFCWNCNGQLTILQNPKFNIVKMQTQSQERKIGEQGELDSFYKSLLTQVKSDDMNENFFFLNDANEDEEFHTQFDKDPLTFEDENQDEESAVDYLNFKVAPNKVRRTIEEEDSLSLVDKYDAAPLDDDHYFPLKINQDDQQHMRLVCLIKQITTGKPKTNSDLEMNNRISIYNFQSDCLDAENALVDFLSYLNIDFDMTCFQDERLFVNMLNLFMEKPSLKSLLNDPAFLASLTESQGKLQIFYHFDKECLIYIHYLKNFFNTINKQDNISRKKINETIQSICSAILIENYINFINIRAKMLEITRKLLCFCQPRPQLHRKVAHIEHNILHNTSIQSFRVLGQVKNEIASLLQLLHQQNHLLLTVSHHKLTATQQTHEPLQVRTDTPLKKTKAQKYHHYKKSMETIDRPQQEIVFAVQVNQFVEQVQNVELISIRKKNIYTSILNESIKNLRKRCFFDSSRQLLKIMSFNYNIYEYLHEMNRLIDSFNALNQPAQPQDRLEKPFGKKISTAHPKAKRPAAMNCVVCAQLIQGLALICRKCKHGGHLGHLREWFSQNKTCPCCPCECFQLMK